MRFVYVGVPYAVWELMKCTDGTLATPIHFEHENPGMLDWVKGAMRHRTGIDTTTPIYCHVTSKDAEKWWSNTPRRREENRRHREENRLQTVSATLANLPQRRKIWIVDRWARIRKRQSSRICGQVSRTGTFAFGQAA